MVIVETAVLPPLTHWTPSDLRAVVVTYPDGTSARVVVGHASLLPWFPVLYRSLRPLREIHIIGNDFRCFNASYSLKGFDLIRDRPADVLATLLKLQPRQ